MKWFFQRTWAGQCIQYLRPTWEGEDFRPSYRRISQFVGMCLIVFQVTNGRSSESAYGFYTLVALLLFFSVNMGIIILSDVSKAAHEIALLKASFSGTVAATPE